MINADYIRTTDADVATFNANATKTANVAVG